MKEEQFKIHIREVIRKNGLMNVHTLKSKV